MRGDVLYHELRADESGGQEKTCICEEYGYSMGIHTTVNQGEGAYGPHLQRPAAARSLA
jgi:hypothetical protein